jgi:hypothetical protein
VDITEGDVREAGSVTRAMAGIRTVVSAIHGFGDVETCRQHPSIATATAI